MGNAASIERPHRAVTKKFAVAIDIETCTKNGRGKGLVAASLVCTKYGSDQILFSKTVFVKRPWEDVENKEFWQGNSAVWDLAQELGTDEKSAIDDFAATWRNLPTRLGTDEENIALISDNPEFDFGVLSHYLEKYDYKPLRWTKDGVYRSIKNLSDVSEYLGLDGVMEKVARERGIVHNHHPEADAAYIMFVHNRMDELRPRMTRFARYQLVQHYSTGLGLARVTILTLLAILFFAVMLYLPLIRRVIP